jgi:hypothetical protein
MAGELGGSAAGANMLQEILRQKFAQALAFEQQKRMAAAQQQQAAFQDKSLGLQRRAAERADESARVLNDQRNAAMTRQQSEDATAANHGKLRGLIQASQNMAGTDDPTGAVGTRNALRVALAHSGAKDTDIPQEPVAKPAKLHAVTTTGPNGQPLHKLVSEAEMQQGVQGYKAPQQGSSHPRFNIVQGADADGKPAMIRTNVDTGQIEVLPIPAGANFVKRDQPATQDQSNLALYANRVEQADPILKTLEGSITKMNPLSFAAQLKADHPSLQSAEIQQYNQAARNFINAVLRRESGAAIAESEFANARGQYLPVPGDSPQVLAQKAENRRIVLENYKRSAGPAYKSMGGAAAHAGAAAAPVEYDYVNGKLVPRKQ